MPLFKSFQDKLGKGGIDLEKDTIKVSLSNVQYQGSQLNDDEEGVLVFDAKDAEWGGGVKARYAYITSARQDYAWWEKVLLRIPVLNKIVPRFKTTFVDFEKADIGN